MSATLRSRADIAQLAARIFRRTDEGGAAGNPGCEPARAQASQRPEPTPAPSIASTRILHASEATHAPIERPRWIWPLPRLDGVAPCIVEPVDRATDHVHLGYPGDPSLPSLVPVFAAHDGVIAYASTASGSPTICLDHAGGWSTQYAELEHLLVTPTDRFRRRRKARVRAGEVLGHARRSPLRIRFGLAQLSQGGWVPVDAAGSMPTWALLPWFAEPAPRAADRRAA